MPPSIPSNAPLLKYQLIKELEPKVETQNPADRVGIIKHLILNTWKPPQDPRALDLITVLLYLLPREYKAEGEEFVQTKIGEDACMIIERKRAALQRMDTDCKRLYQRWGVWPWQVVEKNMPSMTVGLLGRLSRFSFHCASLEHARKLIRAAMDQRRRKEGSDRNKKDWLIPSDVFAARQAFADSEGDPKKSPNASIPSGFLNDIRHGAHAPSENYADASADAAPLNEKSKAYFHEDHGQKSTPSTEARPNDSAHLESTYNVPTAPTPLHQSSPVNKEISGVQRTLSTHPVPQDPHALEYESNTLRLYDRLRQAKQAQDAAWKEHADLQVYAMHMLPLLRGFTPPHAEITRLSSELEKAITDKIEQSEKSAHDAMDEYGAAKQAVQAAQWSGLHQSYQKMVAEHQEAILMM